MESIIVRPEPVTGQVVRQDPYRQRRRELRRSTEIGRFQAV